MAGLTKTLRLPLPAGKCVEVRILAVGYFRSSLKSRREKKNPAPAVDSRSNYFTAGVFTRGHEHGAWK